MTRRKEQRGWSWAAALSLAALSLAACESENPFVDSLARLQQPVVVVPSSKLLPDQGAAGRFGSSVACDGTTAVIGAPLFDAVGLAHVFRFDGANFVQEATLVPSFPQGVREFGAAVAVRGDAILVGAPGNQPGTAFVFRRSGGAWTEEARLAPTLSDVALFGWAVALDDDRAAIGAPNESVFLKAGTAHVFRREGGSWQFEAALSGGSSFMGDRFGSSVGLDGDILAVGAPTTAMLTNSSVHVFSRATGSWVPEIEIKKDGSGACWFGEALALSGTALIIGCPVPSGSSANPYVNVYERTGSSFAQVQKLLTPGPSSKSFGSTVALSGSALWIGAPRDDEAAINAGAVAAYSLGGATWSLIAKVKAPSPVVEGQFGTGIAAYPGAALVGVPGDDGNAGSVWIVSLQGEVGEPCTTNGGCESGFCVDGVCCESSCGNGLPDDCLACSQAAGASQDGACEPISGTACEDGNPCTQNGTCVSGSCEGSEPKACEALDECHEPGTCDPNNGCSHPKSEDGKACTGGTCLDGVCVLPDGGVAGAGGSGDSGVGGGTAGSAGSGGAGLDGGAGSGGTKPASAGRDDSLDSKGFYACAMREGPRPCRLVWVLGFLLMLVSSVRRRNDASVRG